MNKYELTIVVDGDQEEAIRAFFAHNNWNFEKIGNYEDDAYIYIYILKLYKLFCVVNPIHVGPIVLQVALYVCK